MQAAFQSSEIDLDYVLYTDCDVLLMSDVNTCTAPPKPAVIYAGGESQMDQIANTGTCGAFIRYGPPDR